MDAEGQAVHLMVISYSARSILQRVKPPLNSIRLLGGGGQDGSPGKPTLKGCKT